MRHDYGSLQHIHLNGHHADGYSENARTTLRSRANVTCGLLEERKLPSVEWQEIMLPDADGARQGKWWDECRVHLATLRRCRKVAWNLHASLEMACWAMRIPTNRCTAARPAMSQIILLHHVRKANPASISINSPFLCLHFCSCLHFDA